MEDNTTISISKNNKRRLEAFGKYGDDMNDIIGRVLKKLEECQFLKKQEEDNNV